MTEPKIYRIKLSDLIDDPANANRGTERGQYMLDASIAQVGAARGIVIDKEGRIIAGNKTRQAMMDAGIDEAVVVETDGKQLVVTQRADMDLADNDPNNLARKYAYYDNRTSEVSLDWDPEQILADINSGLDFKAMFRDDELVELVNQVGEALEARQTANDPNQEWRGMPEFENKDAFGAVATLKVHFASQEALREFSNLIGQNVNDHTPYIWFPRQQKENLKQYQVIDEP